MERPETSSRSRRTGLNVSKLQRFMMMMMMMMMVMTTAAAALVVVMYTCVFCFVFRFLLTFNGAYRMDLKHTGGNCS
jgi:hypothetical protein